MTTPNMNLPIPTFNQGVYPSEIATAFNLIDDHDHTAGKGAPILGSGTVTTLTGLTFVPVVGQQIFFNNSTLQWELGRADDALKLSTATIIKVTSTSAGLATHSGTIPTIAHGFTVGQFYYQDPTVLGGVTLTIPTNADHYNRPAFQVIDANTLFVLNSMRPIKVSDGALATVTISAGAGDAGKVPKLDADGKLNTSFSQSRNCLFSLTANYGFLTFPSTQIGFTTNAQNGNFAEYFTVSNTGNLLTCLKACTIDFALLFRGSGPYTTGNYFWGLNIYKNAVRSYSSVDQGYAPAGGTVGTDLTIGGPMDFVVGDTFSAIASCGGTISGATVLSGVNETKLRVVIL